MRTALSRLFKPAHLSCAAVALCLFLALPALAQDDEGGLITPADVEKPPAAAADNPNLKIGDGSGAMPVQAAPKVAKRDEPRTVEPMGTATSFFEKKVFAVPEGKGKTITYFFKGPAPYQPKDKMYPLVLILHDDDGAAPAAQYLAQKAARKAFPAFIAIPVLAPGHIWAFPAKIEDKKLERNGKKPQDLDAVMKMLAALAEENPTLDVNRIYVIGCGEGGFGVFGAAAKYPNLIAAGVPIAASWGLNDAGKLTKVPMFVMAGADDKEVDPGSAQTLAYYIQQSGGKRISYLAIPGMEHDCANPYLYNNAVWAWMFKQHK